MSINRSLDMYMVLLSSNETSFSHENKWAVATYTNMDTCHTVMLNEDKLLAEKYTQYNFIYIKFKMT